MLYLYRRKVSEGARELEDALNDAGTPTRFTQGKLLRERFRADRDQLICWGDFWPAGGINVRDGIRSLNNSTEVITKFAEAERLAAAGVRTVEVSQTRPITGPARRPAFNLGPFAQEFLTEADARGLQNHLANYFAQPLPPVAEWLPRRNNHVGGRDLLRPGTADYYSKKESICEEYRLHIFRGKSIRAGVKVPREMDDNGNRITPHEWIRSFDAGWRINYDGYKSRREQREIASAAVQALGLDFGAVDLGLLDSGDYIVLEVNRAPGIEGGSVDAYVGAIGKWLRGEE